MALSTARATRCSCGTTIRAATARPLTGVCDERRDGLVGDGLSIGARKWWGTRSTAAAGGRRRRLRRLYACAVVGAYVDVLALGEADQKGHLHARLEPLAPTDFPRVQQQ